jgi:hypothetical protein
VVEAQQALRRNARSLPALRDPARMGRGVIDHHTRPGVGAPPSITSALSWQPLCCSSNVRGVECGGARKVRDVFHEVQLPTPGLTGYIHVVRVPMQEFPKRNTKFMHGFCKAREYIVK